MKITDRKTEIVNVSAKLFKEKGYSAVTMRDIAQAMDIKAASLYNHIKSKQEILVLIIIEIAEEFTNVMNEVLHSNDSAIKKIERIIQLHVEITLRDSNALACLNNDWMHLTDSDLEYFIKMRNDYEDNFKIIVKKGIQDGEIKNLNLDLIIFSILSTLRTLYIWYNKTNKLSSKALTDTMIKVLLNGIVLNS